MTRLFSKGLWDRLCDALRESIEANAGSRYKLLRFLVSPPARSLMSQPLLYALAAMICYGFTDFVYKRAASAAIRPDHFLMAQAWFFFPIVVVYAWLTGTLNFSGAALWGALAGLASFIGFFYFFRSLASGTVSTNASIFRLNFLVTVVLAAAFLGEPLSQTKLAGLALALIATWLLLAGDALPPVDVLKPAGRSLGTIGLATVSFGASTFLHTVGLRHGAAPETLAVAQAACFMPLATVIVYRRDGGLKPQLKAFPYGAAAAFLLLGATISLLHGIAIGQASVLVPISQMGFIVAALLGVTVLGEPVTACKIAGLAAALGVLAALASG